MSHQGIKVVMGGAGMLRSKSCTEVPQLFDVLASHGVDTIDTAVIYGESEELLGIHRAGERFTVDTKNPGGMPGNVSTKEGVQRTAHESLSRLRVDQVDILYLHAPDLRVPFAETLDGLNELYKAGVFRRLGLSNFKPEQVQEVYDICRSQGYVLPKVYQGNYNPVARSYEETLLPLLRKLGMSFYAYSPQAGGFLSKTAELVTKGTGEGRFNEDSRAGNLYRALYTKPLLLEGLTQWNKVAQDAGIKGGDMAVRWVRFNSALQPGVGDAIIIGGRNVEQVSQTLDTLDQGPLPAELVAKIDEIWATVRAEAPVDNYHDWLADNLGDK